MSTVRILIILVILALIGAIGYALYPRSPEVNIEVTSFEECAARYPVLESYPRQCNTLEGRNFVEDIGNELEKQDLIRVNNPRPNQVIESPLTVEGEARGFWFFEATFPVTLLDEDGVVMVETFAQAQDEWMTEDFVPFQSFFEFSPPSSRKGTLILEKDNPSGLPEYADQLRIPILFRE